MHCDIKHENIVLMKNNLKLIDFRISQPYFSIWKILISEIQSLHYMIPEILLEDIKYDSKYIYILSIGCIIYYIVF